MFNWWNIEHRIPCLLPKVHRHTPSNAYTMFCDSFRFEPPEPHSIQFFFFCYARIYRRQQKRERKGLIRSNWWTNHERMNNILIDAADYFVPHRWMAPFAHWNQLTIDHSQSVAKMVIEKSIFLAFTLRSIRSCVRCAVCVRVSCAQNNQNKNRTNKQTIATQIITVCSCHWIIQSLNQPR